MKKILTYFLLVFTLAVTAYAQDRHFIIQKEDAAHIIKILAADSMTGRRTYTPGIQKAADFIAKNFNRIGLQPLHGENDFRQEFEMINTVPQEVSVRVNGQSLSAEAVLAITSQENLDWSNEGNIQLDTVSAGENFFASLRNYLNPMENTVVWVDPVFAKQFTRIKNYLKGRANFPDSNSTVFILSKPASNFKIEIKNKRIVKQTANIVGVLPGDTYPNEIVIFSAHYDHIGTGKLVNGDRIYNGANDNASGTTAVIELAKYYKAKGGNNRTIIFVAFTGEEMGFLGSRYFSKQFNPENIIAMFNIEMIGTRSKWGQNSVFITGFHKSSFGEILQENMEGNFKFNPDPYPKQNLFYRSDNATLARLGVPAHTISTAQMKNPENYHKVSDEVSELDLANMTRIIRAIAEASEGVVSGEDTPSRVDPAMVQ